MKKMINRERVTMIEGLLKSCHPELADFCTDGVRIASRRSGQERSSYSDSLRAWKKSKTDSGSYHQKPVVCNMPSLRGAKRRSNPVGLILPVELVDWIATPPKPARNDETLAVIAGQTLNQVQGDSYDDNVGRTGLPRSLLRHYFQQYTRVQIWNRLSRSLAMTAAFTMAEILLSLTIIGVVAAITLPSLTGNINERTWNTQRKALLSRFSQAIALMPSMNGYGSTDDNAAETFITNGLAKVLKINNICGYGTDGSDLFDCGFASQIIDNDGVKQNLPKEIKSLNEGIININSPVSIRNTKAAAFETANGESILAFYNPNCTAANVLVKGLSAGGDEGVYIKQHVCANFVYDLNGKKGPNTVGKDVGALSVIYSSDSKVIMPMYPKGISGAKSLENASAACHELDEGQYRLPNIEELLSLYYNKILFGTDFFGSNTYVWSSTSVDASTAYAVGAGSGSSNRGIMYPHAKTNSHGIVCVQRF